MKSSFLDELIEVQDKVVLKYHQLIDDCKKVKQQLCSNGNKFDSDIFDSAIVPEEHKRQTRLEEDIIFILNNGRPSLCRSWH